MIGDPSELWKRIGKTLWYVQLAEYALVHLFVTTRVDKKPDLDLNELLEHNFKSTVGLIVNNLRQAGKLNDVIDKQISDFVYERNWLAHHIQRLHKSDIHDEQKYTILLARLDALKGSSHKISTDVADWLNEWALSRGLTHEEIEAETANQLKAIHGEI